jgi:hypothetical protein
MAKGIYERKGKNGDVTYYIRYQVDGTDIKERVGRKSRGSREKWRRARSSLASATLPKGISTWRK